MPAPQWIDVAALPCEVMLLLEEPIPLVVGVSGLLVATGLKRQPGIGIIAAAAVIAATLWWRGDGLAAIGFGPPPGGWWRTALLGLMLGVALQLVVVAFLEPWSERITGSRHDHGVLQGVRGDWGAFLRWMVLVWVLVVFLEEGIFRGFLMSEIARFAGAGWAASTLSVAFTAAVFGLAHGYQGRAGMVSTGAAGIVLGVLFVATGLNVWLAVFTHGFVNTVGIALIASGTDDAVRRRLGRTER